MAKQQWEEINLGDAVGMASNPVAPGQKFAKRLLNVHPHVKPGALTLRPGYSLKYAHPTDSTIDSPYFLNFAPFFDRQADPEGQEIICLVQKGIVEPLEGSGLLSDTMPGLQYWVRPYWDGSSWVDDDWQWVNKTIITKITEVDATYLSHFKIFGDAILNGLENDALVGWTIYNKTKDQFAKVITNKFNGSDLWINTTLYNNAWEVDDILIISRMWIDIDAQTELYNNVTREDIVFHRILNDLRIGFGGKANRPGIAIGYRKKYFQISEVDFTPPLNGDITAEAIELFAKIDGVMLDTNVLNNFDNYGIGYATATGDLPAATYYFRLTGIIDGYAEQLLAETQVELTDSAHYIELYPYIVLGRENPRITGFKLYKSTDNITFYKIKEYVVKTDEYSSINWKINAYGKLILGEDIEIELHTESNAASIASEINSEGSWTDPGFPFVFNTTTPGAGGSTYTLRLAIEVASYPAPDTFPGTRYPIDGLKRNTSYNLTVSLKYSELAGVEVYAYFVGESLLETGRPKTIWTITNSFVSYSKTIYTGELMEEPKYLVIGSCLQEIASLYIDLVSIKEAGLITYTGEEDGTEMKDEMGYTPTYDLVKGWDQALVSFNGRVYYLNPYLEKRYENFLVVSHIAPPATFMRDIASFSNFRELEKYDSNETLAIELLQNREILILKDASITTIADDGLIGQIREPIYGIGCISRGSVVNINGLVFWCDDDEIFMLNIGSSLIPKPLLKETIRDLYLAITDKEKIFGTRGKFNTYKIRINDSSLKTEFLLTETGWIEERKYHYPEIYRGGFNNKLYFMNAGNIYEESADYSLSETDAPYGGSS